MSVAKRAHSHTVEIAGASHSVYVSHPKEVADVIEGAARAVSASTHIFKRRPHEIGLEMRSPGVRSFCIAVPQRIVVRRRLRETSV